MRFEVSEQVRTRTDIATIICALFEQLAKVSARVRLTEEGNLTAKRIDPSLASIVRFDQTNFIVEPKEGGFLFVAEVSYRPSSTFWVILIMCIPTFIAWLVPIFLYNWQKDVVRLAIGDVFERVKNEFEVIEAPSRIGIRPAMIVRGWRRRR
jgi:adenine/guanine phosphoribosyltransferase-like PRPP-binding protein